MSQYYDLGGVTLWNPSNGVSRLFLAQLAHLESELGLPSGIGPMENDEAPVSPPRLRAFAAAALAWRAQAGNPLFAALTDGALAVLLVLADRAGVPPAADGDRLAGVRAEAERMGRAM